MDLQAIIDGLVTYLPLAAGVIAACAAVAVVTPTKVDDALFGNLGKAINVLLRVVNILGLNFGKAVNKDDA